MPAAPIPYDDEDRVRALLATGVLSMPSHPGLDAIAEAAAVLCDAPSGLVSLVDSERQWFKGRFGVALTQTDRSAAFCAYAILSDEVMWVEDARADPRFADSPLVTGAPFIRFYAGAPIIDEEGYRLGTVCVFAREPRARDERLADALARLATRAGGTLGPRDPDVGELQMQITGVQADIENLWSLMRVMMRVGTRVAPREFTEALRRECRERFDWAQVSGDEQAGAALAVLQGEVAALGLETGRRRRLRRRTG